MAALWCTSVPSGLSDFVEKSRTLREEKTVIVASGFIFFPGFILFYFFGKSDVDV